MLAVAIPAFPQSGEQEAEEQNEAKQEWAHLFLRATLIPLTAAWETAEVEAVPAKNLLPQQQEILKISSSLPPHNDLAAPSILKANLGYKVSGSDKRENSATRRLDECGAKVHIGHAASNIKGCDVVVVSTAVDEQNPEIIAGVGNIYASEALWEAKIHPEQKKSIFVHRI